MGIDRKKFLTIMGLGAAIPLVKKGKDLIFAEEKKETAPVPEAGSSDQIPVPITGKKWAMVVDLKKCQKEKEGCRKCIDACHIVHNVPEIKNPKHEIKWLWKEKYKYAFPTQKHDLNKAGMMETDVILLCNHCDNPSCVRVCPTQATFKRKSDGIVMMDMHRCIGCRFCMAACPYGSRSFNWLDPRPYIKKINLKYPTRTRGVVEKCNFCAERLAVGQMPACVSACEEKCMVFGDVEDKNSEVRQILSEHYSIVRKPHLGTGPRVYYIL